jgi:hypothetical protein
MLRRFRRLLSSNSYASAKRAIWLKTAAFYLVGLLLLYYYQRVAPSPPGAEADQVPGHFIRHQLPVPVPGLVMTASRPDVPRGHPPGLAVTKCGRVSSGRLPAMTLRPERGSRLKSVP